VDERVDFYHVKEVSQGRAGGTLLLGF